MENKNTTGKLKTFFNLINGLREELVKPSITFNTEKAHSFFESLEECACEMANEIATLKATSNNCFVKLNKDSKQNTCFCRPYYLNGAHAGNIHYIVEHFCESNFSRVGDVIDGIDNFISSRVIEEKTPSRTTYGCLRFDTPELRAIVNSASVVAITESKCQRGATAVIHLGSGKELDTDLSYETVVSAYLDYLGKERGTIKRPAGI